MGLKAIVAKLEDVDEALRHLYQKKGEVFVLDVSGIDAHPMVATLKTTMTNERDARKDIEKAMKDLKAQTDGLDLANLKDIDLEKYNKAMADLEEFNKLEKQRNTKKLTDKSEWEKLEKQLREGHTTALDDLAIKHGQEVDVYKTKLSELATTKDRQVADMRASLENTLKVEGIVRALAEAGGNIPILTPHVAKHVKVLPDDAGKYSSRVVDADGVVRINDLGQPMTISELVTEIKQKPEFKGEGIFTVKTQQGGSGSGGNLGGTDDATNNPWAKETENLTEQGKILKNDPAKAARLEAAAAG